MWNSFGFSNYAPELREVLEAGIPIFDDTWCTHVPEHKTVLQNKIIRRYYFNQIGAETPERFVHYLNEQLARIMPYYNQLYASELIKIDPIVNTILHTQKNGMEKLAEIANTSKSEVGKKLRDFIGTGRDAGNVKGNVTGSLDDTLDKTYKGSYTKDGTEHVTDNLDTSEHTTEDTTRNTVTDNEDTKKTTGESKSDVAEKMVDSASTITKYSDTPQRSLGSINESYLTNYTDVTGSETRDTTTGTTASMTEDVAGTFDGKEDVTANRTADTTGDEDRTVDKRWDEEGSDQHTAKDTRKQGTTQDSTEDRISTSLRQDKEDTADSRASTEEELRTHSREDEATTVLKGINGVSPSDLLEKFRATFLRIDEQIINDLRENFMGIF